MTALSRWLLCLVLVGVACGPAAVDRPENTVDRPEEDSVGSISSGLLRSCQSYGGTYFIVSNGLPACLEHEADGTWRVTCHNLALSPAGLSETQAREYCLNPHMACEWANFSSSSTCVCVEEGFTCQKSSSPTGNAECRARMEARCAGRLRTGGYHYEQEALVLQAWEERLLGPYPTSQDAPFVVEVERRERGSYVLMARRDAPPTPGTAECQGQDCRLVGAGKFYVLVRAQESGTAVRLIINYR